MTCKCKCECDGELQQVVAELGRIASGEREPCLVIDRCGTCWLIDLDEFDDENDQLPGPVSDIGSVLDGLRAISAPKTIANEIQEALDADGVDSAMLRAWADRLEAAE